MTMNLAVVMITVDRSPGVNYLAETLENLSYQVIASSRFLSSFQIVSPDVEWALRVWSESKLRGGFSQTLSGSHPANLNTSTALRYAAAQETDWALFLEDDIDVIKDFFPSVLAWLEDFAVPDVAIYPLGANYPNVNPRPKNNPLSAVASAEPGAKSWRYPTNKFYGTQAVAIRGEVLYDLADFIKRKAYGGVEQILSNGEAQIAHGSGYDLIMARWHRENFGDTLLTPIPSFVQHTGRTSCLTPNNKPHLFPSWPGRSWSFVDNRWL